MLHYLMLDAAETVCQQDVPLPSHSDSTSSSNIIVGLCMSPMEIPGREAYVKQSSSSLLLQ